MGTVSAVSPSLRGAYAAAVAVLALVLSLILVARAGVAGQSADLP